MDRHTHELLHDPTTHEAVRRFEMLAVMVVAIMVLYGIVYRLGF